MALYSCKVLNWFSQSLALRDDIRCPFVRPNAPLPIYLIWMWVARMDVLLWKNEDWVQYHCRQRYLLT
jgi:hypothetical protein